MPEALEPGGIGRERLWQNFQCDIAIEFRIPRAVDLPHTACANGRKNLIGTDMSAGCQRHGEVLIIEPA